MDLGIEGKIALITGGSRGLGRQSALSLAGEGVNVAICGRTEGTLNQAVDEIRAKGVSSMGIVADVSDTAAVEALHKRVVSDLGPVDILVNNVGGSLAREDFLGTSLEDFKGTFDLNVFGGFQLMKLVTPHMVSQKWGRIINIASIWGREHGGNISYMAAKAALSNYLKILTHRVLERFLRQFVWFLQRYEEEPHEETTDVRYHLGST